MEYRLFKGYEEYYPEKIAGTNEWFCGISPSQDASDIVEYNEEAVGTRLLIFNIDGTVIEPIKQTEKVLLEYPVYSNERNSFGLLRYDFNAEIIQMYEYFIQERKLSLLTELPLKEGGDLINLRIEKEPFMLVKTNIHEDNVRFIYPMKATFPLESNETLFCIDGKTLITTKWVEDPDYREEIITRKMSDGSIIQREKGYIVEMPNGHIWKMTE